MNIQGLTAISFESTLKRLKKSTKSFSRLLVRDIFDNLDFLANEKYYLDQLIFELISGKYSPNKPYYLESPKSKGVSRPTIVLSIEDSLVYRFCIESIEDELFAGVDRDHARGGMKISAVKNPEGDTYYEKWFDDWLSHNKSIEKGLRYKNFLVTTDVASYFENINILLLKDLVRSRVKEKSELLNLLFYFIESTKLRNNYEVNTFNGLLQEDIDCSRILAYFFLSPHDECMREFCKVEDVEFYRFVDDMSFLVNSELQARKSLKVLTRSLRNIGLLSSIEKTAILTKQEASEELFLSENEFITTYEKQIITNIIENKDYEKLIDELIIYYQELKIKKGNNKNWAKILKRFYTVFSYSSTDILLEEVSNHLINFPALFIGQSKLTKYLIMNKNSDKFNETMRLVINYLYSGENLYPALETSILELLLNFKLSDFSLDMQEKISNLGSDIFFRRNYTPQSEYARALSCLLIYNFKKRNINELAIHYCKCNENDQILKKYLISTALTTSNNKLRQQLLDKAKREQGISLNRLVNLIDNIQDYAKIKSFKDYLKTSKLYIYYHKKDNTKSIIVDLYDVRKKLLKDLIEIYSS